MGIFRLSFLTTYMSDALIAGYTTGRWKSRKIEIRKLMTVILATATHVLVSQINKIIGVKLPRYSGNGMLFFVSIFDVFFKIKTRKIRV